MDELVGNLINLAQGIYKNQSVKELYHQYQKDIEKVTPQAVFAVANEQLKMGLEPKEMLEIIDKLINIFYKSLAAYAWKRPIEGTFLYYLMAENKSLIIRLNAFKVNIKNQAYGLEQRRILDFLEEMEQYNYHLQKLENILFPYLEQAKEHFEGLKIFWSLHDAVRVKLKELKKWILTERFEEKEFNVQIGQLFFGLYGLVQKQELILFPAATEVLDEQAFKSMQMQSFDYPFFFIEEPIKPAEAIKLSSSAAIRDFTAAKIQMETGTLSFEQLENMLNSLPMDLTFVDEKDEVAFFNKAKDRFFPRSVAVIGRNVKNCHPPESVHVVEKILESFKKNQKDQESFWIQMQGKQILIQYFAVRNTGGVYLGTLEVSQDISGIRSLEGEKRLLDEQ